MYLILIPYSSLHVNDEYGINMGSELMFPYFLGWTYRRVSIMFILSLSEYICIFLTKK